MAKQYHDPIRGTLRPFERLDLTRGAYEQTHSPAVQAQDLRAQVAQLQRRGA
ncbi:MAG: hypothetical protein AB7G21_10020 [Dehalococcoidia bacterium]